MFSLQPPVSWPPLVLLGLGLSAVGAAALMVHQLRRQVQAAWAETGRVYQRSTARFTAVGDLLEDALLETDATRTITYTNRAFHDLTGYRHRDLQAGLRLADMFDLAGEGGLQEDLATLREPGSVRVRRALVCRRDGARMPVTLRLSPVCEQDRVVGWRCLLETRADDADAPLPVDTVLGDILRDVGNCGADQLQGALARGLEAIGRNLGADRCYHYASSPEGGGLRSLCQWYAPGVSPMSGDDLLPALEQFPWARERLREDGVLLVPDVERLDAHDVPERERWRRQGITSLLVVPLRHQRDIVGILGCETLGHARPWSPRDRQLVEAMAQICQRIQNHHFTATRLDEANSRAGHLVELLPEPVAVADRGGAIVAWNEPLTELSGKTADAVRGRDAARVLEEALPGAGAWLRAQLTRGSAETVSSDLLPAGDRWLQLSLRPLANHEFLLHVCDMTRSQREAERIRDRNATLERAMAAREKQLEEAQAQLLESEKNMAVARMVTGLAHELNTPVGVGLTAASHLQDRTEALARAYRDGLMRRTQFEEFVALADESSTLIVDNLQRAADLVSGMRQAAVDQAVARQRPVPLRRYLGDVLLSLRPRLRERHVEVDFTCPDDLVVHADPGALYRVVSNLVMNAVQHAFDGMLVGRVALAVSADDDTVALVFSDDGRGMSADQRRRIYDPFFTTARDSGGMGLGLHIVYNLVTRNLGGGIECESVEGRGTTFRITLPALAEEVVHETG